MTLYCSKFCGSALSAMHCSIVRVVFIPNDMFVVLNLQWLSVQYQRTVYDHCTVQWLAVLEWRSLVSFWACSLSQRSISVNCALTGCFFTTRQMHQYRKYVSMDWKAILAAVFSLAGYRYLTDRREILHGDTYRSRTESSAFGGGIPRGTPSPKFRAEFWPFNRNVSKTVSRSVTCQLELNISSTRAF